MSSNALDAQGIELKIGDGEDPEEFTVIPEIKTFSGPGGSATVIDVTDLQSAAKEKRMGLQDEGQLTFDINYIPADTEHAALRTARADQAETNFEMVFTDDPETTWAFSAFVTGFSVSGGVDGVVEASVTLEITGAITES
ncbi:MAG: phage tail tube protein [Pirellulaceae bacterium]